MTAMNKSHFFEFHANPNEMRRFSDGTSAVITPGLPADPGFVKGRIQWDDPPDTPLPGQVWKVTGYYGDYTLLIKDPYLGESQAGTFRGILLATTSSVDFALGIDRTFRAPGADGSDFGISIRTQSWELIHDPAGSF